jgi:hypothetical protein
MISELETSSQNYWVFGLFHRPVFLGIETRRFGTLICFRYQVKGGENTYLDGLRWLFLNGLTE